MQMILKRLRYMIIILYLSCLKLCWVLPFFHASYFVDMVFMYAVRYECCVWADLYAVSQSPAVKSGQCQDDGILLVLLMQRVITCYSAVGHTLMMFVSALCDYTVTWWLRLWSVLKSYPPSDPWPVNIQSYSLKGNLKLSLQFKLTHTIPPTLWLTKAFSVRGSFWNYKRSSALDVWFSYNMHFHTL